MEKIYNNSKIALELFGNNNDKKIFLDSNTNTKDNNSISNEKEIRMFFEVYSILNLLGNESISKLPKSLYEMIKNKCIQTNNLKYKTINDINIENTLSETMSMIALFHLCYWCNSQEEKDELNTLLNNNELQETLEKNKQYPIDDIFKNKNEKINTSNINENTTGKNENHYMIEYKTNFFSKVLNLLKKLLK